MTKPDPSVNGVHKATAAWGYISDSKKRKFLAAYARLGTAVAAEQASGVSRKMHYLWMKPGRHYDPEYVEAFRESEEESIQRLEDELRHRGEVGDLRPDIRLVSYVEQDEDGPRDKDGNTTRVRKRVNKYEQVGSIREKSDACLIFLLKSKRPDKYRERYEHSLADTAGAREVKYSWVDSEATLPPAFQQLELSSAESPINPGRLNGASTPCDADSRDSVVPSGPGKQ